MHDPGVFTPVGIVMAAGKSTRFGSAKQLALLAGKPLLSHVLGAATSSMLRKIILVLGHQAEKIQQSLVKDLSHPKILTIFTPDFAQGQSNSIRAALKHLPSHANPILFLAADQPLITPAYIDELLSKFNKISQRILIPCCDEMKNPAMFDREYLESLNKLKGDEGARSIIKNNPDDALIYKLGSPSLFMDIDFPEDLIKAEITLRSQN